MEGRANPRAARALRPADRAVERRHLRAGGGAGLARCGGGRGHPAARRVRAPAHRPLPVVALHPAERRPVPRGRRRVHRPLPAGAHLHGLERGQPPEPAGAEPARPRGRVLPPAHGGLPELHGGGRATCSTRATSPAGCADSSHRSRSRRSSGGSTTTAMPAAAPPRAPTRCLPPCRARSGWRRRAASCSSAAP